MPIVDNVALHAQLRPERPALVDLQNDKSWTYAELNNVISKTVSVLRRHGLRKGDRLAVLSRNAPAVPILHYACARLGAIIVPLNWRLARAELDFLLSDCEPKLVLGDDLLEAKGIAGTSFDIFFEAVSKARASIAKPLDRDRPSLILYTSGTSGRPKGALLSERNIEETAINFSILTDVSSESVFLCDAPMFHIVGLITNIRPALMRGGASLISSGFDAATTLRRLGDRRLNVSHYVCVPQMAAALRAVEGFDPKALSFLKTLVAAGAPHAPAKIKEWLDDEIIVTNGYGMTEIGTALNTPLDIHINRQKAGSVGISTHRVETRIIDAKGRNVRPGEPGELLVRGDSVIRAYWRRDEDNRKAFLRGRWFRTGDIVRQDKDGFFWLLDRHKDMFISGGENVYPAEVEAAVLELEGIAECAVVGTPDAKWGEVGHLFWVAQSSGTATEKTILHHLQTRLAKYKIPKYVTEQKILPRNGAGKILKTELRELPIKVV